MRGGVSRLLPQRDEARYALNAVTQEVAVLGGRPLLVLQAAQRPLAANVCPGAESAPAAGDDHHLRLAVLVGVQKRRVPLVDHLTGERIHAIRAI